MFNVRLKKTALILIPGLSLLFFSYGNYWSSHWYAKWSLIVGFFCAFYSWFFSRRTSFALFPIMLVSTLSAAYVSVWNDNFYLKSVDSTMNQALGKGGLYSLLTLVMASFLVVHLPKKLIQIVEFYLGIICLSSCFFTIGEYGSIAYERGAFSGNASMNASLIACLVPFAIEYSMSLAIPVSLLAVTACALTHSSIGLGTLSVVLSIHWFMKAGISFKWMASLGAAASVPLLFALKYVPAVWLSSSGRLPVWKAVFSWWINKSSILFGAGLGTGISLFPSIQKIYHVEATGYMLWLHSDWLQVLFELGIFGFIAALIAYIYFCFRSYDRPHLFSSLIGFGTCAIADYPLRLPIHCTAATLLVWLILQNKKVEI